MELPTAKLPRPATQCRCPGPSRHSGRRNRAVKRQWWSVTCKLESMRLPGWRWLALSSLLIASSITGALRPHYGGTLTVDLSSPWTTLDPRGIKTALPAPVAETLVRVGSRGQIEAVLAVAWQHDPDFKRWRFSLRPKVTFHDGEALTGASAAPSLLAALKQKYGEVSIEAGGQAIVVQSDHAMPDLLGELALPG